MASAGFEDGRRDQKTRYGAASRSWKREENRFPLIAFKEEHGPANTLISPGKFISDFLAYRMVR